MHKNTALLVIDLQVEMFSDTQNPLYKGHALLAKGEDFSPGAFPGFFLEEIASLTLAFVMLHRRIFGKVTAYAGIIGISFLTVYAVWVTFIPALQGAAMILAMVGGF